jgi:hypothetical protein
LEDEDLDELARDVQIALACVGFSTEIYIYRSVAPRFSYKLGDSRTLVGVDFFPFLREAIFWRKKVEKSRARRPESGCGWLDNGRALQARAETAIVTNVQFVSSRSKPATYGEVASAGLPASHSLAGNDVMR